MGEKKILQQTALQQCHINCIEFSVAVHIRDFALLRCQRTCRKQIFLHHHKISQIANAVCIDVTVDGLPRGHCNCIVHAGGLIQRAERDRFSGCKILAIELIGDCRISVVCQNIGCFLPCTEPCGNIGYTRIECNKCCNICPALNSASVSPYFLESHAV